MDELVAFLTAQLDEREARAREFAPASFALADVAARRAILGRAVRVIAAFDDPANAPWPDVSRRERSHAVETIHDLAQPYAHDPGFKAEWRPSA